MIQRQQTLWLLLATLAALLTFMFPFVTGKAMLNNVESDISIKAGSNFFILILTGASLVLSTLTIFLYKNRKQQIQLCLVGIVIATGIIVLYILQLNKLTKSTLALAGLLPFLILIGYYLAFRNIRKDEKLVKSLDKLR
jgi:hypothetical protein